jgi:4-hydroxybenzoyl-CoA thioesterase
VIAFERAVRFEEVDAAGILFFARYLNFCHDAMEHFFGGLPGGYPSLITKRRVGLPAVHVAGDFRAPLRYGDVVSIETSCTKIGETSATLRYVFRKEGAEAATIDHVIVSTSLDTMTKLPLPSDVRAILEAHVA